MTKCPGTDIRNWTHEDIFEIQCPNCDNAIEFFKDDPKRLCVECNFMVINPRVKIDCLFWCRHAQKCGIGEDKLFRTCAVT